MFSSHVFLNQICFSVHIIVQINYPPLSENNSNLFHSIQNTVANMICLPCTHHESLHWFIPLHPINIQVFVFFHVFHVCICPFLLIIPSFVLLNADSSPHHCLFGVVSLRDPLGHVRELFAFFISQKYSTSQDRLPVCSSDLLVLHHSYQSCLRNSTSLIGCVSLCLKDLIIEKWNFYEVWFFS